MSIDIRLEDKSQKCLYQASVYQNGQGEYFVAIGRMGVECPLLREPVGDIHTSPFLIEAGIQRWVGERVDRLRARGAKVQFHDGNALILNAQSKVMQE